MSKGKRQPAIAREIAKRKSHLDHVREDLDAFCDRVNRYSGYAPPELVAECAAARDKLAHAYQTLAPYDESAAASAISTLTRGAADTGILSILAGYKTAARKKEERSLLGEMRDWHRRHPELNHGWKSQLARYLVEKTSLSDFPYTFHGARKFLWEHGYFLD